MFAHILIPTDGSALATLALAKSLEFAREAGADVTVLMVVEPFRLVTANPEQIERTRSEFERHAQAEAAGYLADAQRRAQSLGVRCHVVQLEGLHPYEAIIGCASDRGCDLIAMGSHGRSGLSAALLGSVTTKVLAQTKMPVLVYR